MSIGAAVSLASVFPPRMIGGTGSGSAGPVFPGIADLVFDLNVANLTPQADGSTVQTIADSINGISFTNATVGQRPQYKTVGNVGTKPSLLFSGGQWLTNAVAGALGAAIASQEYTVIAAASHGNTGVSATAVFGASAGGGFCFSLDENIGRFDGGFGGHGVPNNNGAGLVIFGNISTKTYPYTASSTNVEWTMVQGMAVSTNVTSAGPVADSSFCLGAFNGTGLFPCQNRLYRVMAWKRRLTETEYNLAASLIYTDLGVAAPWAAGTAVLNFDGDSITAGVGATVIAQGYPYKAAASLGLAYGQWNVSAVGGASFQDMFGARALEWTGIAANTGKRVVNSFFEWYNDGNPPATIYSHFTSYCTQMRTFPSIRTVAGNSTGYSGDPNAARVTYNGLVTGTPSIYDQLADLGANANIGSQTAYATFPANWSDAVHLSNAGYTILAGIYVPLITAAIAMP